MQFRQAVARAGTFYLAQGNNGAIYGALTFVSIANKPGWNSYGPGETLIFSVTNKKIYKYAGKTGKPIWISFNNGESDVFFGDEYGSWALGFNTGVNINYGESHERPTGF